MKLQLIAVGTKMPNWITVGYQEYARRFPKEMSLTLIEVPAGKRGKNVDINRILEKEGALMLAAVPKGNKIITLEIKGNSWTTEMLADEMRKWQLDSRNISLLIGGPEGLSAECIHKSEQRWSLSPLTMPHPIVRVIVAESLYRAFSVIQNHPYHRE